MWVVLYGARCWRFWTLVQTFLDHIGSQTGEEEEDLKLGERRMILNRGSLAMQTDFVDVFVVVDHQMPRFVGESAVVITVIVVVGQAARPGAEVAVVVGFTRALGAGEEVREESHDELSRDVDTHVEANQLQDQHAVRAEVIVHEVVVVPAVAEFKGSKGRGIIILKF